MSTARSNKQAYRAFKFYLWVQKKEDLSFESPQMMNDFIVA